MNGLMLHCGAHEVTRDAVYEIVTPEPSHRGEKKQKMHYPIPHTLLLEEVEKNLVENGYEVVQQAHALTQEGQRYYGLIEVRHTAPSVALLDDPSVTPDYGLVIGLRNAHDGTYSAALAMGSRVFVCDNLGFSGEVLIGRRHTRNIARDIPLMIPRAFGALSVERVNLETRIEAYKGAEINDRDANDLIVRALVDEKIFPTKSLPHVVQEWRTPSHDEFQERTIWSLFNAFTEVAKPRVKIDGEGNEVVRGANLNTLMGRTRNLHGFFDKSLGLQLKSREELDSERQKVLAEGAGEDVLVGRDAADHYYN